MKRLWESLAGKIFLKKGNFKWDPNSKWELSTWWSIGNGRRACQAEKEAMNAVECAQETMIETWILGRTLGKIWSMMALS